MIKKMSAQEMFPKSLTSLGEGAQQMRAGQRYRHKKTRGTYRVACVARIEATLELVVVYVSEKDQSAWVRPLNEFLDGRFVEIMET